MATAGEQAAQRPQLFNEVAFSIIQGPHLSKKTSEDLCKALTSNGAVEVPLLRDDHDVELVDLEEVTHIIAADIEFSHYPQIEQQRLTGEVDQRMIPIVTPEWVTASLEKKRLSHVRVFNPDPRFFFSGVYATVADLPEGDKEAIYGGIMAMGGQYGSSLTKLTTHLVALNMEADKCKQAIAKNLPVKIVLPHWFDDCLKLNRRIDEKPYLLPNPEIETKSSKDLLPLDVDHKFLHAHPDGKKGPPAIPRGFKSFVKKRFLFANDLELSPHLQSTLQDIIEKAGGELVSSLTSANVILCQWREGEEYKYGRRNGMDVGNLTWLYWMIGHGEWASPTKLLLHFPRPKQGIEGMEKMAITVSNYGGDARLYLENLIEACGAKFTRTMKMENTHLITARDTSEKCKAAREWNIDMVNHLWLEESYANWKIMPLSTPRYSMFPRRTNLGECVAQTRIELDAIAFTWAEEEESEEMDDLDMPDAPTEESRVAATSSMTEQTPQPKKTKSRLPQETPIRNVALSSPASALSSGSRRAKDNAINRLHNTVMPDLILYEKEKKRKGGVLGGGRRSTTPDHEKENGKNVKKRGHSADEMDIDEDEAVAEKAKKQKKVPISVYLLVTAHQAWLDTPSREESDKKKLRAIGIQCIQNPEANMTHLCAPSIVRTEKFVCALSYAPIIVSASWVEACLAASSIIDSAPFLLHDEAGEEKLKITLSESLKRAAKNQNKLLEGVLVYLTEKVPGGFETLKKVIEVNGGQCVLLKTAKKLTKMESVKELVVLATLADKGVLRAFNKICESQDWVPRFYKTDWLLDVAMTQKLEWKDEHALPIEKD